MKRLDSLEKGIRDLGKGCIGIGCLLILLGLAVPLLMALLAAL